MRNIVITGANRGIGLEYCKQFKQKGDHVIALCRQSSPELRSLSVEVIENVNVAEDGSMNHLKKEIKDKNIDVLINNAGILRKEEFGKLNFETIKKQFDVNTLGPLKITQALLPNLKNNSKVVMMTSRMGSITDNTSGGYYGYRMSKAALNIASVCLSHELKEKEISLIILHPGFVKTEMTNHQGNLSTSESVEGLIKRIEESSLQNTGHFLHTNGEELSW